MGEVQKSKALVKEIFTRQLIMHSTNKAIMQKHKKKENTERKSKKVLVAIFHEPS